MIEILKGTDKFPLSKIGECAGICWGSPIDDAEKNIKRAKDCILSGHGRVLEYVDIEMVISDVSARMIREWYTHIGGSPTRLQESTRYVKWEGGLLENMVIPPSVNKIFEVCDNNTATPEEGRFDLAYRNFANSFKYLLDEMEENKIPKEDMAMFYPLGMKTKIVDKRNLRNLIEMTHQRLCSRAYWEYRNVMKEICTTLHDYSDEWAWIVDNCFKPKCEVVGYCIEAKCCGRKPKKIDN